MINIDKASASVATFRLSANIKHFVYREKEINYEAF